VGQVKEFRITESGIVTFGENVMFLEPYREGDHVSMPVKEGDNRKGKMGAVYRLPFLHPMTKEYVDYWIMINRSDKDKPVVTEVFTRDTCYRGWRVVPIQWIDKSHPGYSDNPQL